MTFEAEWEESYHRGQSVINQVLGRLPRGAGDQQHEESANQIGEAFLHNLNALRYPENDPVTTQEKGEC